MRACLRPLVLLVMIGCASAALAEEATPAQTAAAQADLQRFVAALTVFQADCGELPSDRAGLGALLVNPCLKGWNGPYLPAPLPSDPWKSPYRYRLTKDDFYEVRSAGADKKFDTADDITPAKASQPKHEASAGL